MKSPRRILLGSTIAFLILYLLSGCDFFAGLFNPLIGTWAGSVTVSTMTMTYTSYMFKYDNSYTFSGTFSESGSGVSGTTSGSGTYIQDQSAKTITGTGTMTWKSTSGPSQYYQYFDRTENTSDTTSYSISGNTLTLSATHDGTNYTITLTRQ